MSISGCVVDNDQGVVMLAKYVSGTWKRCGTAVAGLSRKHLQVNVAKPAWTFQDVSGAP
jgi:hypothetical protein